MSLHVHGGWKCQKCESPLFNFDAGITESGWHSNATCQTCGAVTELKIRTDPVRAAARRELLEELIAEIRVTHVDGANLWTCSDIERVADEFGGAIITWLESKMESPDAT